MGKIKNNSNSIIVYFIIAVIVFLAWYLITYLDTIWLNVIMKVIYSISTIIGFLLLFKLLNQDYSRLKFTKYIYFFNISYFSINYVLDYILLKEDNNSLIYVIFLIGVFRHILKTEKKLSLEV